jgi:hypothetical protein
MTRNNHDRRSGQQHCAAAKNSLRPRPPAAKKPPGIPTLTYGRTGFSPIQINPESFFHAMYCKILI